MRTFPVYKLGSLSSLPLSPYGQTFVAGAYTQAPGPVMPQASTSASGSTRCVLSHSYTNPHKLIAHQPSRSTLYCSRSSGFYPDAFQPVRPIHPSTFLPTHILRSQTQHHRLRTQRYHSPLKTHHQIPQHHRRPLLRQPRHPRSRNSTHLPPLPCRSEAH